MSVCDWLLWQEGDETRYMLYVCFPVPPPFLLPSFIGNPLSSHTYIIHTHTHTHIFITGRPIQASVPQAATVHVVAPGEPLPDRGLCVGVGHLFYHGTGLWRAQF